MTSLPSSAHDDLLVNYDFSPNDYGSSFLDLPFSAPDCSVPLQEEALRYHGDAYQQPPKVESNKSLFDASSNSGELPDLNSLVGEEAAQETGDIKRHREKNRAAQKRFRMRQKSRMASSAQQVEELAAQMKTLAMEKQRLEAQNRVLQHTVQLSSRHIQDTAAEKDAYAKQQERIMMETSRVYWREHSKRLELEDVKSVTMEAFVVNFERFLGRYRHMLENGGKDPMTQAGRELRQLVLDRRGEEARAALFSEWVSASYAWNKEETDRGLTPPSRTFWSHVLDRLEMSAEQQQSMLEARRRLLKAVTAIRRERERTVVELGLALLQKQAGNGTSVLERRLRDSLEMEREAVLDFMYSVVDLTMHPWQEAAADLYSHPWHPDLWALCGILAERHRQADDPPDISSNGPGSASLLPHYSAAEMLWTPILARGAGLQLKRTLVSRETPKDVLAAAAKPLPTIARMKDMTMFELYCGKHLADEQTVALDAPSQQACISLLPQ